MILAYLSIKTSSMKPEWMEECYSTWQWWGQMTTVVDNLDSLWTGIFSHSTLNAFIVHMQLRVVRRISHLRNYSPMPPWHFFLLCVPERPFVSEGHQSAASPQHQVCHPRPPRQQVQPFLPEAAPGRWGERVGRSQLENSPGIWCCSFYITLSNCPIRFHACCCHM